MNNDWARWLTPEEKQTLDCSHLLSPPGHEAVLQWAKWLCKEREKLALARGFLYDLKFGEEVEKERLPELDWLLGYTKGESHE